LAKSADTWAGPFKVTRRFHSGSYQLSELDGTIIRGSVPASHLKPFYVRGTAKGRTLEPEEDSDENMKQFQKSDEEDLRDEDFHTEE
jgi:hypothetical protein